MENRFSCPFCNSTLVENENKRHCPRCFHEEFIYRELTEEEWKEAIRKFDDFFRKRYKTIKPKRR